MAFRNLILGLALLEVLLGSLAPSSRFGDKPGTDLRAKVNKLIEQLADPDPDKQAAAETALLQLGPDILPLLPESTQDKRLNAVRSTLREAQALKDSAPQNGDHSGKRNVLEPGASRN